MADGNQIGQDEIAITPPGARTVRFLQNLVQNLITSQTMYYKRSRSKGQRSKSLQR